MPELLEVEAYRQAALITIGRRITAVDAPDPLVLTGGLSETVLAGALVDRVLTAVRRHGKLLMLDTEGPVLGLHFGMTGRLLVDGQAAIEHLEYGSDRPVPAWDRLVLHLDPIGELRLRDPRRLARISLEPIPDRLGPDAADISTATLRSVLGSSVAPLKARLLDQHRVAGLGNLLVDESLWRAGLAPTRPAGGLDAAEIRRLAAAIRRTVSLLGDRGGSHTGDLHLERKRGGHCPRDGAELRRETVGGRTTYWCPEHQR